MHEAHQHPAQDAKHCERDGLRLQEVAQFEQRPGHDEVDEAMEADLYAYIR